MLKAQLGGIMEAFVYESKKAIVRIHTGQRSEEERRKALEEAVKQFYLAIQKTNRKVAV